MFKLQEKYSHTNLEIFLNFSGPCLAMLNCTLSLVFNKHHLNEGYLYRQMICDLLLKLSNYNHLEPLEWFHEKQMPGGPSSQ